MSSVSFTGLATGLDTASIVTQLVEIRRAPIYRLQSQRTGYEAQKTALDTLKAKLTAFQDAAQAIDSANEFASLSATSNDDGVLGVTADSTAAPGSYDIEVLALAQSQKSRSQGFDNTLVDVGSGTLTFTVGGEEQALELTDYTSIESLAERINSEIDGLNAAIVYDGSETGGYHLVLTGDAGTGGAFSVDTSGLTGGTVPTFTETQTATNASLTVDGLPITADGNHLDNVISGLTLDLNTISDAGTSVRVTVTTDTEGVMDQVKAFIDTYNELFSYLETAQDTGGDLDGNGTASASGGGNDSMLAQIGIERQQGSQTLTFDEEEFTDALSDNYSAVRDLFIESDANIGKASLIDTAIDQLTDSIDGMFKIGADSLTRRIDNIDDTIDRYELSIENYQSTLEAKFLAMETAVSSLQAQGTYLSSMTSFSYNTSN